MTPAWTGSRRERFKRSRIPPARRNCHRKCFTGVLQEGLSQHASGARIVRAMQDFLHALRGAAAALGPNSTEAELVSGAGALLAGVSPATLTEIRAARGKETVVVPLVVLGDLVARGVAAPAAGGAIANAARHGIPDRDFNAFRERVETAIASGSSASAALDAATRGVTRAAPAAPDSMTRRPKPPPGDPENYGRAEFDQASGNQTTVLRELSADALVHTRPRTPFAFAGNALLTDGSPLSAPSALANASMLAVAGTANAPALLGESARDCSVCKARFLLRPACARKRWERRGPWTFSIDAAFGAVPACIHSRLVRSISTSSSVSSLWAAACASAVAHGDSARAPIPRASSPGTGLRAPEIRCSPHSHVYCGGADAQSGIARVVWRLVFEGSAGIRAYAFWPRRHMEFRKRGDRRLRSAWGSSPGARPDRRDPPLWSTGGARFFAGVRLASAGRLLGPPARASVTETENVAEFRVIPGAVASTLEMRIAGARSVRTDR